MNVVLMTLVVIGGIVLWWLAGLLNVGCLVWLGSISPADSRQEDHLRKFLVIVGPIGLIVSIFVIGVCVCFVPIRNFCRRTNSYFGNGFRRG